MHTIVPSFAALIFAALLVIAVQRIDRRVRAIKVQLNRLSLTFRKIENDLEAIQNSLVVLAEPGEMRTNVEKLKARRSSIFQHLALEGPSLAEVMRGLEEPDIDEDPPYWATDRLQKFGFEKESTADV